MRKPASCVLSIALSVVMSVGLIPSPAFAEIDSTPKPATQSANKPNENPAETTSDQTQPNEPNDAVSNPSSETPNQTPECSPSDINATGGASPSNESASDDSATALQSDADSASNDAPRVDWRIENRFKWMITADGTLVLRIAELADLNLKYESWKAYPDLIEHADLSQLDTSRAKDLRNLFYGCTSLQSVDLSQLDMSNVTSMRGMFTDCKNLKSINLSGIDTSNVTDMSSMFYGCQSLESLDLSQLNTINVTDMNRMFTDCKNLQFVNLSGIDTINVTNMSSMFYGCKKLGSIDLSAFKTVNVTNVAWMFYGCEALKSMNLSGLDMSSVTDMSNMFASCKSLESINLQGINTSNVTSMVMLFFGCKSLNSIDISQLDTSNATSMAAMFSNCESLSHIDLSNVDASKVTDMASMFSGCKALKDANLSNVDASNVTNMASMFSGCKSLEHINLTGIKTPKVTDVSAMFSNCASLESIDISPLDTSNVTTISSMFSDCKRLKTISLAGIDTSHVANFANAFKGCSSLATVDLAGVDTTSATDMDSMFAQCTKLQAIDISTFDMSKLGKDPNALSRMFDNCPSLERITVGDKCAVSFPEPGGSRATGNWINTASNQIYAPINVPANVAATYESQLDVTQFPFFYNPDDVTYTGSPIEKKVTSTLKLGRDYTVAYANNTKVGTAAIAIAGTGRYAGSMELPYDIVKATPSYPEVKGLTATCGQKLSDIALPEGFAWESDASATVDTPGWPTYTATYTPADTANYSTVSGIEVTVHATQPIDASMFSIKDTDIRYTGNPVMPTVTSSTVPSDQYTVTYENNVAIGQATAIVTATNQNYSGTCKIPFEIKPTNAAANYQHSTTAQSGDIMLTVQWNDPQLGQETTFHVSATGGSGAYRFRMDAPTYMDPDGSNESVADPSRNQWQQYTGECASHDYQFEMTASGTYYLRFYLMDKTAGVYYLRANVFASANDDAYPAVSTIVKSAVDKCNAETDGSDYARALWLHDWTLDQLEYDHNLNWCSAESGLTRHQGTCESYQRIYTKLLDAAGIANGRIEGNGHTWNTAKIDGKWCQMDLTWDDTNDNWYGDLDQRHLYFGLTDELMAIAHSDHTANYQAEGYAYRSTDLTNNYFVRNGKADEWASQYADRIQQHLDARETEFSIDADNQSFPPSISGIQNGIVAHAMNQREWKAGNNKVDLTATSSVTTVSGGKWTALYEFTANYTPAYIIASMPKDCEIPNGAQAEFTVTAPNASSYQWQCSDNEGRSWYNTGIGGGTSKEGSLRFIANTQLAKRLYRCAVSFPDGTTLMSDPAHLTLAPLYAISSQPKDCTVAAGSVAQFNIVATQATSYQWQCSDNGGRSWYNTGIGGETSTQAKIEFTANAGLAKRLYRCYVSFPDGTSSASSSASLKLSTDRIIQQPKDTTAAIGAEASFSVQAQNATIYRWQCSDNNGKSWYDTGIGNAASMQATLRFTANNALAKRLYRCVVTFQDGATATTCSTKFTLETNIGRITVQPQDCTTNAGAVATFTVEAEHAVAHQWQCSDNGGKTWYNTAIGDESSKSKSLSFTASEGLAKRLYRCMVTFEDGSKKPTEAARLLLLQ